MKEFAFLLLTILMLIYWYSFRLRENAYCMKNPLLWLYSSTALVESVRATNWLSPVLLFFCLNWQARRYALIASCTNIRSVGTHWPIQYTYNVPRLLPVVHIYHLFALLFVPFTLFQLTNASVRTTVKSWYSGFYPSYRFFLADLLVEVAKHQVACNAAEDCR